MSGSRSHRCGDQLRVAIVCPYDLGSPGGVREQVLGLAEALREHGDRVTVLGPGRAPAPRAVRDASGATSPAAPRAVWLGRSVPVPFNGSVARIAVSPGAPGRTRRALAALSPDVVHVHEPLVPWVGLAAACFRGAPVVATFHASSRSDRLYRLARPATRRVVGSLAGAIAVSDAAAAYHAGALGVDRDDFEVVPNGVDVRRFAEASPLPALVDPSRSTLLFLGRLEPRKGLETLIRAFLLLCDQPSRARLLIVGDGPERARCEALVPERLRGAVRFLGRLPQADLPGCYAAADVFVSPATGGESFGVVLLEAMAAGRAVVASDIDGYREVVADGRTGRLVPPGDPVALAAALGELLDDEARRSTLAAEGRRHVGAYDWPEVAARVRARYRAVRA